ncbi:MAG: bifunctional riboflavin kinase/FAD synthetase [Actinomycetota bacterium]|nr:bifunctional riboflavin kinase/FAD synthetase [Actinomycetota bacterium]
MHVIRNPDSCPRDAAGCGVTIGAYDGLHLGHRAVIDRTRAEAEAVGAATAVVTFDRHPASVVRPESAPKLLTTLDQKLELLEDAGVDYVYVVEFDERRAKEGADEFVEEVLVDCLRARVVVVGSDFHFGRDRTGNVALLTELGARHGFRAIGLDLLSQGDGRPSVVSSTAIRAAVAEGDVVAASRMLGRPLEVRGIVAEGDKRGRTIGFPTANVMVPGQVAMPADSVYAGWYVRPNGAIWPAAINLGRRPTFYEHADDSLLEAHLIGFEGDLYGEQASVRFVEQLRGEVRFDGLDALAAQLRKDVADSARLLASRTPGT